jgi:4-diphosphocytidyl-2-C-methyl-D-erythritol kinase
MLERSAPAKINLFLRVLAREASGYHQIETLFCRIALADTIVVQSGSAGIDLDIEGQVPGELVDNLVYRAADRFYAHIRQAPAVRIRLVKRIPIGAGLGGGSSDAATTLHALNAMHGEPVDRAGIIRLAAGLGSDVAFFATHADLALAWGRGERTLSLDPLPERPVLLVVPDQPMSTAEAYAALAESRDPGYSPATSTLDRDALASWESVAGLAANDFEDVVFRRIDELVRVRNALLEAGASIALLAGSGSALFGIFDTLPRRAETAAEVRHRFPGCRLIETVTTHSYRR